MASTSNKRKYLRLSDKVKIIDEVALGAGVTQLAKKYGVSKATICKIKLLKTQILQRTCDTFGGLGNRKTLKNAKAPRMENCLYEWFLKQRENHDPISGEIIKERAKLLNERLKETENFVASDGWLQRFKRRYGIRLSSISGEKLSAHPNVLCTPADINVWNEDKHPNDIKKEDDTNGDDYDLPIEVRSVVTDAQAVQDFNQALDWAKRKEVSYTDILLCTPVDINVWNEDKQLNDVKKEDTFSDDEALPTEVRTVVTDAQAIQVFNQALDWAERKKVSYMDILVLRRLQAQALEDNAKCKFMQANTPD